MTGLTFRTRPWLPLIGLFAFGLVLGACAPEASDEDTVIEGFGHPESVTKDATSGAYYVSNIGEAMAPGEKDGDGYVARVNADGTIDSLRFLPQEGNSTLHAPKGTAVVDGILYVTDIDRIVGFDLDTREQVFTLDFASTGTTFLNDLAAFDDSTLFASATDIGTVFRVSLGDGPRFTPVAENVANVNGLRYDGAGTLYLVSYGEPQGIWRLALDADGTPDGAPELLREGIGQLDGLAILPENRLLISDWQSEGEGGALRVYDLETDSLQAVGLARTIQGPADFYHDAETNRVWIPALPENRVIVTSPNL